MRAGRLLSVGVVVLAGVAWFALRDEPGAASGDSTPLERGAPEVAAPSELPEAPGALIDSAEVPEPTAVEPEVLSPTVQRPPREFVIVEVVTKDDELPVPGARVSVFTSGSDAVSEDTVVSGVTDADGRCELAPLLGKLHVTAVVPGEQYGTTEHSHRAGVSGAHAQRADAASAEISLAVVRVEVGPLTEVRGRVVDPSGAPLEGVRVSNMVSDALQSTPTLTDAEGLFTFAQWRTYIGHQLRFERDGCAKEQRMLLVWATGEWLVIDDGIDGVRAPPDALLEIVMSPHRVIRGRVVDSAGSGVPDLDVIASAMIQHEMFGAPDLAETRTDPDGSFVVEGTRVDIGYVVRAGTPELGIAMQYAFPGEVEIDLGDLELQELATLSGRLVDVSGQPAGGAEVELRVTDLIAFDTELADVQLTREPALVITTKPVDADGRFEVRAPRIAGLDLIVRVGSFLALRLAPDLSRGPLDLGDLVIEQDAQHVHGQLLDADGTPLVGAQLSVGRGPNSGLAVFETAADGSFDAWLFTSGAKQLVVEQLTAGSWVAQSWTVASTDFPATLRLDPVDR